MHPALSLYAAAASFAAAAPVLCFPRPRWPGAGSAAVSDAAARAEASSQFEKTWMSKVKRLQTQDHSKPTLKEAPGHIPRLRRRLLGRAAADRTPDRALRRTSALHGADVLVPEPGVERLLDFVPRAGDRDLPLRERTLVLLIRTEPGPSGAGGTAGPEGLLPRSSGRARPVPGRPPHHSHGNQGRPGAQR